MEKLGRGIAWLDTGTHQTLLQAASYIEAIQKRQGLMVGCIEEVAYHMGWLEKDRLAALGKEMAKTNYGNYLRALASSVE